MIPFFYVYWVKESFELVGLVIGDQFWPSRSPKRHLMVIMVFFG